MKKIFSSKKIKISNTVLIFILIVLLSSCLNPKKKNINIDTNINKKIDTTKLVNYKKNLKTWIDYYKKYRIKLEKFNFVSQDTLPNIVAEIDTINLEKDIYKFLYKISNDKNKVLDLYSYNLSLAKNENNEIISYGVDIDSEVSIKDLKNKIWKRILFVGPNYKIEEGFWINNDKIIIVGVFEDEKKCKPVIWFVNLNNNTIQSFEYSNYIDNIKCDYLKTIVYKKIKM